MKYSKLYQLLNTTFPNNVYNRQSSIETLNKTLPYVVLIENQVLLLMIVMIIKDS